MKKVAGRRSQVAGGAAEPVRAEEKTTGENLLALGGLGMQLVHLAVAMPFGLLGDVLVFLGERLRGFATWMIEDDWSST